ncbi:hypothetical protein F385_753 [Pantoea agglomerans 299R]|nr:hypothetical protein F385_753 [Pantoea agglomerans 299R]
MNQGGSWLRERFDTSFFYCVSLTIIGLFQAYQTSANFVVML